MVNRTKEWRVCKHLYEMYLSNPETFYTAGEISRNIITVGGSGCHSKRKKYCLTTRQIASIFRCSKIYEYAEFDVRDVITDGLYGNTVHEYRFKRGLVKEFQP